MTTSSDELRRQVRAAFARLTPEHREIISLAHFQKLTLRQIAHRTGISIDTARRRATDALHSLKDALDDAGAVF
jgi:RNA polymerase sigma-70 factor (ECF subfamily)